MSKSNTPRTPRSIVSAPKAFVSKLVDAFTSGEAAVTAARVNQLTGVALALEGYNGKVDGKAWKETWAKPVKEALIAAGYGDASAGVTASRLRLAVIGVTNGYEPKTDETLQSYGERVREPLTTKGVIDPVTTGRKGGGGNGNEAKPQAGTLNIDLATPKLEQLEAVLQAFRPRQNKADVHAFACAWAETECMEAALEAIFDFHEEKEKASKPRRRAR